MYKAPDVDNGESHVCVYVYTYVCVYIYMYVCMYAYI